MLSLVSRMAGGKLIDRQRVSGGRKIRAARQAMLVTSLIVLEPWQSRMAQAGLNDWKPVLTDYDSSLTLQAAYTKQDDLSTRGINQRTASQVFRESIKMNGLGYVYHPDLMLFRLSGKYGVDEDNLTVNEVPSSGNGGFEGYELESILFRAKPYVLSFFSRKDKPFNYFSIVQTGETRQESGADFKYLKDGQRAGIKYNNTTSTDINRSDYIDQYESYYGLSRPKLGKLNNFTFSGVARYQDNGSANSTGDGGNTVLNEGILSNSFDYSMFNFSTSLNGSTTQMDGIGSSYFSDTFVFYEGIQMSLPWNFNSIFNYSTYLGDSKNKWRQLDPDTQEFTSLSGESKTNGDRFDIVLTQRLYDSLETNFSAKHDSAQSLRVSQDLNSSGQPLSGNPVDGLDETNEYGMTTQYRKMLPRNSTMTASLSSNNNQQKQVDLSSEARTYSSVQEDVGIIQLGPTTDTSQPISVEVLLNNSDTCKTLAALNNPLAPNRNFCWGPLTEANNNYRLNLATLQIEVRDLSLVPFPINSTIIPNESFYKTFKDSGGFTFRVISFRKAGDFTVQTNQLTAGLTLFQFISSNYQHSVTNQDGSFGGHLLASQIISDTLTLGFSLYDWIFNASQEWDNAIDSSTNKPTNGSITNFTARYSKSRKFWDRLTVSLGVTAEKGWATSAIAASNNSEQSTESFSYSLAGDMPLPYIKASLKANNSYGYSKGTITRYESYSTNGPRLPTRDTGISEQTSLNSSISLSKPFKIPWIDFAGTSYVRYRWETQTTTDNAGNSDGGRDRSYLAYGVSAGRGWQFGSTTLNLNTNYAITEDAYDEFGLAGTPAQQAVDQTNRASVTLTLVRALF